MTDARNMRKLMEALEERLVRTDSYKGSKDDPNISYDSESKGGEITKVIAHLQSDPSGRYTKLGRNLLRMERIKARMDALKEEVKGETRELIADLFNAADACRTREVETVSFIFMMTKDPKVTVSPKYKDILEELTNHMTPELVAMKDRLLKQMVTETQKAPSIRVARDKAEEGLEEGMADTWKSIRATCRKVFSAVLDWGKSYDARLDRLKAEVAMAESAVKSADYMDTNRSGADIKWGQLLAKGWDKITKRPERKAYDQHKQRKDNKAFIDRENELRREGLDDAANPLTEEPTDDPRLTGEPIEYRGWEIGYDSEAALWTKEGYYCHVLGWEPGDPDGEDGTRSTVGLYWFGSVQDCKDQIDDDLDGEPLVQEDDFDMDFGDDWHSQDDLADYNNAEADDYRNEGGDEDEDDDLPEIEGAMELEDAVVFGAKLLGVELGQFIPDGPDAEQARGLVRDLHQYARQVSVQQKDDGSVEFNCADPGSVNLNYNPLATAWIENGRFYWES